MSEHDGLYHRLFSHPLMVEQLLRDFVPAALSAGPDFGRMERVNAKFHARDNRRREGDVIWRIPITDGGAIYLYVLCEFQSTIDNWMAVRTQVYQGLLWQQIIAEKALHPTDGLPPVLMLVLYNGESRWTAPTDTTGLIALPPGSPLWPWQPQIRYHLLDMGAVPGDDLAHRDGLAPLLFRLEHRHDPAGLEQLIDEVIGWFRRHPDYEELKGLFTALVKQAIAGIGGAVPLPDDLVEIKTMLATQGEAWKRQWLAEGRAEGKVEGKAEGKVEGKAEALLRLIEKRFGLPRTDLRERIQDADAALIEAWFDRAIDAPDIETIFATPN